ncbi:MAG: hypothetical protein IKO40_03015 [Kiritimatiellae bacterium]|nr:hypothetical protein [Kiritimatiellia bacterium]
MNGGLFANENLEINDFAVAFLVAHVFLGETLPAAGVVGGLLVLADVAVASSARRR